MTATPLPRPPFDPELEAVLGEMADVAPLTFTADMIPAVRANPPYQPTGEDFAAMGVTVRDVTIAGHRGLDILVSVITREGHQGLGPGIYHTHGGGMVTGDRFAGIQHVIPWVVDHDAVLVTVEYRLAPEFPDPYPVEDCYAGLLWMAGHAAELGVDPARILIAGASAGGGLAAGTALLARDRKGPPLIGQVLIYPMLDDRDRTVSSGQFDGVGVWDRQSNRMGWTALLGERRGTDDVSVYAAPARAADLSGCRRRSSTAVPRRSSGTRTSPTRAPCGRPVSRPNCMCGPAASTASTSPHPTRLSRTPWQPHGTPGWRGSSAPDTASLSGGRRCGGRERPVPGLPHGKFGSARGRRVLQSAGSRRRQAGPLAGAVSPHPSVIAASRQ